MYTLLLKEAQLHGIKRLEDKKYKWVWTIALLLFMWAAIAILLSLLSRFQEVPTRLVRREHYQTSMEFPAVLLCPEIQYTEQKIEAFLDQVTYPPGLNKTYLSLVLRQLATFYSPDVIYNQIDLMNIEQFMHHNNMNLREVTQSLTTSCEESLIRCRWQGQSKNCSSLFKMELAEFGYCCVFNGQSLQRQLNNMDKNVIENQNKVFTSQIGFRSGLSFVVNQSLNLFDMDLNYKWVAIATPRHFIDSSINGTPISPGKEVWYGYSSNSFHLNDEARFLAPALRGCRLSEERLKYFPTYHNMWESLLHCSCVLLTHPAPPWYPRCNSKNLACAKVITASVTASHCNCPSTCDVDTDSLQTSDFILNTESVPFDSFYENLDYEKVTIVKVFLQQREVYLKLRQAYFTRLELFAQTGGVFNLFFGCSILTLLEMVQLIWYKLKEKYFKTKYINKHKGLVKVTNIKKTRFKQSRYEKKKSRKEKS